MSPAFSVDDLFIRQNCVAFGAPVHRRFFSVSQSFLIHLQENPLVPFVIIRLVALNHPAPVVRVSERLEVFYKILYCIFSKFFRMRFFFYRGVFSRKSERIKPHRIKNVVSLHPLKPRVNIPYSVNERVAHVQAGTGRVWKLLKNIKFFFLAIFFYLKNSSILPLLLPLLLNLPKINFLILHPCEYNKPNLNLTTMELFIYE